MKKKFIGGIALLTIALTFVFAMNLKAQVKFAEPGESELIIDDGTTFYCAKTVQLGGLYPTRSCETCVVIWFTYGSKLSYCSN